MVDDDGNECYEYYRLSDEQQLSYARAFVAKHLKITFTLHNKLLEEEDDEETLDLESLVRARLLSCMDKIAALPDREERRRRLTHVLEASVVPGMSHSVPGTQLRIAVCDQYESERAQRMAAAYRVLPALAAQEVAKNLL